MMDRVYFELADGTILQPYEDWGMLLKHFDAPPPEPRLYTVEIEGMDGTLDMTEWAGVVHYQPREVTISLRDMRGFHQQLVNKLNGRRVKIWRMEEPSKYYIGRCTSIPTEPMKHHVTDADYTFLCEPYRRFKEKTVANGPANDSWTSLILSAGTMPTIPTLTVTGGSVNVLYNNTSRSYADGTVQELDYLVMSGDTEIQYRGAGAVKFEWWDGDF